MTQKEIIAQYSELKQNIHDYIYRICFECGPEIHPEGELPYFSFECDIQLDFNTCGLSTLEMPQITEIRAYLDEGYIFIKADWSDELIDIDDLYLDDLMSIVEAI